MVLSDSQCLPLSELKGLLYHGLMERLSAIRHFLIAGHFNRSINSDVYLIKSHSRRIQVSCTSSSVGCHVE